MIDYEASVKELLKGMSQEAVTYWCDVESLPGDITKEEFAQRFNDYSEDGLASIVAAISATHGVKKALPTEYNGPVSGTTAKMLVVAKSAPSDKMFRYEVAVGPISKEWAETIGMGKLGELLSKGDELLLEELLAGTMLTSHLILQAHLAKAKISKNEASYVDNSSSSDRCATCKSFIKKEGASEPAKDSGGCVKVIGSISPKGRCKLYSRGWGPARAPETGQVRIDDTRVAKSSGMPKADAIEFEGKYYLRLGQSVNTDMNVSVGGILGVEMAGTDTIRKGEFKTFTAYLPRATNIIMKSEPDDTTPLDRLSQIPISGYTSRGIAKARLLYDNDMIAEAIGILDSEIENALANKDRGTAELWQQYTGALKRVQKEMSERSTNLTNALRVADEIYREGERTTTRYGNVEKEGGGDGGFGGATVTSTGFTPTFGGSGRKRTIANLFPGQSSEGISTDEPMTIWDPLSPENALPNDVMIVVLEDEMSKRGIPFTKAQDIKLSVKAVIRKDGKILILKDAGSDWWDLPGGHLKDEEKLEDALAREVKEEAGLMISDPDCFTVKVLKLGKETKPVIFYEASATGDVKLSEEHTDYKWITEAEIDNYNLGVFKEILHENYGLRNPETLKEVFDGIPQGVEIKPEDRITQMEKAFSNVGKVLVNKPITRGGKTFYQKFWVTPEQAKQLGLKPEATQLPATVAPTEAPKHVGAGRPTTSDDVLDLPHTVHSTDQERLGDAEARWTEAHDAIVKRAITPEQRAQVRESLADGVGAMAEISRGNDQGMHITAKGQTQGVMAYFKRPKGDAVHVDFLASAPWNYPKSTDARHVTHIGSRLMAELFMNTLDDEKIQEVTLIPVESAKGFYKKLGFTMKLKTSSGSEIWHIDRAGMEKFVDGFGAEPD